MDMSSIFRAYVFSIEEISKTSLELGKIRVRDSYGALYDFSVNNRNVLPLAAQQPGMYEVIAYCRHYADAKIRKDPVTKEYPPVGMQAVQTIYCELIARGVATPPIMVGMTTMTSNKDAGKNVPLVYNTAPTMAQSDPDYDPLDQDKANQRAAQTGGMSLSQKGGMTIGAGGPHNMNISQKSGTTNNTESQTNSTQETNVGGGMMSSAPNFLQHYLIGLGNAVALPMPHMVNLIKMIAIGKFVKQVIGHKGKRIANNDGTTKWESGTGIYGLGDDIVEATKKKES